MVSNGLKALLQDMMLLRSGTEYLHEDGDAEEYSRTKSVKLIFAYQQCMTG
jgi:hypothetical protein